MKKTAIAATLWLLSAGLSWQSYAQDARQVAEQGKHSALAGRYAHDCSVAKAQQLSYVIGDQSLLRLLYGQQKQRNLHSEGLQPELQRTASYVLTRKYQGFAVHFYQQQATYFAQVIPQGLHRLVEVKAPALLQQCPQPF